MTDPDQSSSSSFDRFVQDQERVDPEFREHVEQAKRDMFGDDGDCPACGAPNGYPPAGPCDNHGTDEPITTDAIVIRSPRTGHLYGIAVDQYGGDEHVSVTELSREGDRDDEGMGTEGRWTP